MMPGEAIAVTWLVGEAVLVAAIWAMLSAGTWLLIVSGRRAIGWSLLATVSLILAAAFAATTDPVPRWVFSAPPRFLSDWYWLFHSSNAQDRLAVLLLFVHPLPIVALVAIAWRKGRRWAVVLLLGAFAPMTVAMLGLLTCFDPGSTECTWAAFGGFVIGAAAYKVTLFVAIPTAAIRRRSMPDDTEAPTSGDPLLAS